MREISIIFPLVLLVALGYALRHRGFFAEDDVPRLTRLLYWVVMPAQLFQTTLKNGGELFSSPNLFYATYIPFFLTPLAAVALCFFICPGNKDRMAFAALAGPRANNLFLGIPAVMIAMGQEGVELAGIYLAVALPGDAIIPIAYAEWLNPHSGTKRKGMAMAFRKILKNPIILSCLAGVLAAQMGFSMPQSLEKSFTILSASAAGIALLVLGMTIRLPNFPRAVRRSWGDVLIKLVVHPALVWFCFQIWPVSTPMLQVAMVMSVMPNAINTFIVAAGMGLDQDYAVETVAVATVFSALTLPFWMKFIGI